ncbi:unnamed protein product [Camellia sinensis]
MGARNILLSLQRNLWRMLISINGFNLIIADLFQDHEEDKVSVIEVSLGIHVLSNASLDSPWPKIKGLSAPLKKKTKRLGEGGEELVLRITASRIEAGNEFNECIWKIKQILQNNSISYQVSCLLYCCKKTH